MDTLITELLKIFPIGQVVGLLLLGVLVYMVHEVRTQIMTLNGSIRELKIWSTEHDKRDTERFDENRADHRALWSKVDKP